MVVFNIQKKTWTLPNGTFGTLKFVENKVDLKKLQPPKVKGIENFKTQPLNTTTPIRIQRWFVELQVVFLLFKLFKMNEK